MPSPRNEGTSNRLPVASTAAREVSAGAAARRPTTQTCSSSAAIGAHVRARTVVAIP